MRELSKLLLAVFAAACLCAGCVNGGAGSAGGGQGSIEMYGTLDQGITVHN
ncbi:hypothetical protein [Burkholderia gladioli]|uniref:hypothetical protein n=1 Tax=Burkholderia gladioli TaxID=28095 RepID=UPI001641C0BB|nr:hypothetical protein [Burkholderia gladioli]MBU9685779.1 hypothetical protein [Burkholderia gladioli]MDN7604369.1 hypothetical protein [Burkholderia gladioli]